MLTTGLPPFVTSGVAQASQSTVFPPVYGSSSRATFSSSNASVASVASIDVSAEIRNLLQENLKINKESHKYLLNLASTPKFDKHITMARFRRKFCAWNMILDSLLVLPTVLAYADPTASWLANADDSMTLRNQFSRLSLKALVCVGKAMTPRYSSAEETGGENSLFVYHTILTYDVTGVMRYIHSLSEWMLDVFIDHRIKILSAARTQAGAFGFQLGRNTNEVVNFKEANKTLYKMWAMLAHYLHKVDMAWVCVVFAYPSSRLTFLAEARNSVRKSDSPWRL